MEVDNSGTIDSTAALGIPAIMQTGGSLTLNNAGTLNGTLDLHGTTGADAINNAGLWNTSGSSSFGTGTASLANLAGGTITVSGCSAGCAFNFGGAALDTVTNAGTITLGSASADSMAFNFDGNAADTLTNTSRIAVTGAAAFNGLATFDNSGGVLDMRQAVTGNSNTDSVRVSGAFGGGTLGVNAFLGGAGSTADTLHVGGSASGKTSVAVADTNPGIGGFTGAAGIPIVVVAGASSTSSFVLDPSSTVVGGGYQNINGIGVLEKGAFDYYLAKTQPGTFGLVSTPDQAAVQSPIAIIGAQTIWYETALGWQDRVASPSGAANGSGFWSSAVGSRSNRSDHAGFSSAGMTTNFDLDYNQNVWGFLLGYEASLGGSDPDAFKLGVMAGYAGADLKFDRSAMAGVAPSDFRYKGGLFGVTATYRHGGFFADALLKADMLRIRFNDLPNGAGGFDSRSIECRTSGAMGNAGFHFDAGGWSIDPMITLAGTFTEIGNVSLPATHTQLQFRHEDTVRGAVGARIGGVFSSGAGGTWTGSVTGRFWDQFSGNSPSASVVDAGSELDLADHFKGTFGEVTGRVDWNATSGIGAWLQAGAKFNSQFTTSSVKAGLRWTW